MASCSLSTSHWVVATACFLDMMGLQISFRRMRNKKKQNKRFPETVVQRKEKKFKIKYKIMQKKIGYAASPSSEKLKACPDQDSAHS